jgi:hypothetical protein
VAIAIIVKICVLRDQHDGAVKIIAAAAGAQKERHQDEQQAF